MKDKAIEPIKKEAPVYFTNDVSMDRRQVYLKVDSLAVAFFRKTLGLSAP